MASPVVWFDMPAKDLSRARKFYAAVLSIAVTEEFPGVAVIAHGQNDVSGCIFKSDDVAPTDQGVLLYFNVNDRLEEAVNEAEQHGGVVVEAPQSIGEHGTRAVVIDSEGNRIALHSE